MNSRLIFLPLIAVLYFLAFGCGDSNRNEPIAVIDGEYVITVGEFLYRYERAQINLTPEQQPGFGDFEEARQFLNRVIIGRILEIEAEKRGYDDKYMEKAVSDFAANLLAEKLRENIGDEIRVTERNVADFYNALGEQRYVQVIFSGDIRAIESANKELNAGVSFAETASVYNENPDLRSSGGDIGKPVTYDGRFFSRQVFAIADEGETTGIVYSPDDGGYLIIRLVSSEPLGYNPLPEYSQVKREVRAELIGILTDKKLDGILGKRFASARVEYDDEVYEAVFNLPQKELRERYLRKGRVVCTANDEPVYFDEWFEGVGLQTGMSDVALDDLKRDHGSGYKELMDGRLNVFIRSALTLAEAKKRGLDTGEGYVREVSDFRSGLLIDRLNDEVFGRALPLPNDEDIRRYFEKNRREFVIPEKMSGFYIAATDEGVISEVYNRVRAGEDVVRLASEISKPGEMLGKGSPVEAGFYDIYKDPAIAESHSVPRTTIKPILSEAVFDYRAGQVSPLKDIGNGSYLFFVNFKYTPYSEPGLNQPGVVSKINQRLYGEMSTGAVAEFKYDIWFEDLQKKHSVVINEPCLKKVIKKRNNG